MFIDFYYGVTVFSGRNFRLNHLRLSFTRSQPLCEKNTPVRKHS